MGTTIQLRLTALLVVALAVAAAPDLMAQDDAGRLRVESPNERAAAIYLKIGDIKGEAKDSGHKEWIDVLSIDWGRVGPAAAAARGRSPQPIVIVRELDRSSPKIFEKIANGEHIAVIEVDMPTGRASGSTPQEYYRYKLENVVITNYSVDASGEVPTETITLNYARIERTSKDG